MMKRIIVISMLLVAMLLVSCGTSNTVEGEIQVDTTVEETEEMVKIGVMGPLSGDAAAYGESVKKAVELAASDLGLDNVELIFEDSKCDAKESVTAANKLVNVDGVVAIIGELCSSATLAAAPVTEAAGVPMVSPASTSPALTDAGEYLFRTVPSDALQGDFGADLVTEMGYERLAVLYVNDDYGIGFKEVLEAEFANVVAMEALESGSVDVRTQLTKIKNADADAVYIITNSPDSAVATLKQITELGLDVAVFASEGLKADAILEGAGDAAEGMLVTSVSTGSAEFAAAHQAAYGEAPGPFAAQGYDAMYALGMAVENGAMTGEEIKDALSTMVFDGVSGKVQFDANGDVYGNYEVYVVTSGAFVVE
jgi:branched-chain amino acid transport system substrate-binding protein